MYRIRRRSLPDWEATFLLGLTRSTFWSGGVVAWTHFLAGDKVSIVMEQPTISNPGATFSEPQAASYANLRSALEENYDGIIELRTAGRVLTWPKYSELQRFEDAFTLSKLQKYLPDLHPGVPRWDGQQRLFEGVAFDDSEATTAFIKKEFGKRWFRSQVPVEKPALLATWEGRIASTIRGLLRSLVLPAALFAGTVTYQTASVYIFDVTQANEMSPYRALARVTMDVSMDEKSCE
jgi:hypothetical protein